MNMLLRGSGAGNNLDKVGSKVFSSAKLNSEKSGNPFFRLDSARPNKLSYLLEKYESPPQLKSLIIESVIANSGSKTEGKVMVLERVFSFLEEYYGGQYRRNGATPSVCHPLSVALGISRLGCKFDTVLTALLHDVLEDKLMVLKQDDFEDMLGPRLGKRIYGDVKLLSRKKSMNYETYMNKITSSRKLDIMLVKVIDTIENLKSLGYIDMLIDTMKSNPPAGAVLLLERNPYTRARMDEMRDGKTDITPKQIIHNLSKFLMEKKESGIDKALAHLEIWKKVNSDLYLLIVGLIRDAQPDEKYMKRLERFLYPSTRTVGYLDAGYADLTWRGELNRSLFWLLPDEGIPRHPDYDFSGLPDEGLPVITIYDASQYQNAKYAHDMIEIEFPKRVEQRIIKDNMLEIYFPFMGSKWKRAKSVLPRELESNVIFRAKRPHQANNAAILFAAKQLSHDLFHEEQMKIIAELLSKTDAHRRDASKPGSK